MIPGANDSDQTVINEICLCTKDGKLVGSVSPRSR